MSELLPCPFCGGKAELIEGGPGNAYVRCTVCATCGNDSLPNPAIMRWNRRAARSAPEATGKSISQWVRETIDQANREPPKPDTPLAQDIHEIVDAVETWRKAVVKPLEWRHLSDGRYATGYKPGHLTADIYTVAQHHGAYYVDDNRFTFMRMQFDSLEAAQAAAQADYEQRILSALASVPAPSGAEPAIPCHHCGASVISTRSPQAVPAEDIAGLAERLKDGVHCSGSHPIAEDIDDADEVMAKAAAALTASEAEATSLRRKLEEHRRALTEVRTTIQYGDGDFSDRLNACEGIVERVLSEREGQE